MASRRMETKPVITCLKTLLVVYSFVFWVSSMTKRYPTGNLMNI
uniref:Uncharacterized protein n=1 Tax=Oncorhynchus tshawytscha TaxID=74940 RepID=A0AAZ3SK92_ONCTS